MSPFQNGYKLGSSESVYIRFKGKNKTWKYSHTVGLFSSCHTASF